MLDDKTLNWFNKHGLTPPSTTSHNVTPEDIRNNLKRVTFFPGTWHLEGNKLTVTTEWGPLVNYISPDYILKGEKDGLPILEKV
jgi:hypothetical protein